MLDANVINQNFDLLSLLQQDTQLKCCGTSAAGPCPFCGGRDRFSFKQTAQGGRWFCRKCGGGKYHTALDYIMLREKLDFPAALRLAGGQAAGGAEPVLPERVPGVNRVGRTGEAQIVLPDAAWQRDALREMWAGFDLLQDKQSPLGQPGRDYLARRGIRLECAGVWQVGFAPQIWDPKAGRKRSALLLPWWEWGEPGADPRVLAIKYRFVDADPQGLRYISRAGGRQVLYGLWDAHPWHTHLLLVEGELNALSIWQMQAEGLTVLSFGSEGATRPEILRAVASGVGVVYLWADDPARALQLAGCVPGVVPIRSPHLQGKEWDANQMLQAGNLAEFLSARLGIRCRGCY